MIYTGLQLITRGREKGISVLELGRKSGYDQKTCFYIIKQLVDLGLVYDERLSWILQTPDRPRVLG